MTKMPLTGLQGEQERRFALGACPALSTPCACCSGFQRPPTPKPPKVKPPALHRQMKLQNSLSIFNPISQFYTSMLPVSQRDDLPASELCMPGDLHLLLFFKRCTLILMKLIMEF